MTDNQKATVVVISLVVSAVSLIVLTGLALFPDRKAVNLGISSQDVSYGVSNLSYQSVSCGSNSANGTGTAIVAGEVGRLSFSVLNTNTTGVYICRAASTCSKASSTIVVAATTSPGISPTFTQTDAYTGGYSCVSDGSTSTISYQQAK